MLESNEEIVEAVKYYIKAAEIYEHLGEFKEAVYCYIKLADIHKFYEHYEDTTMYYLKAARLAKNSDSFYIWDIVDWFIQSMNDDDKLTYDICIEIGDFLKNKGFDEDSEKWYSCAENGDLEFILANLENLKI